jgi:anti-sigma factor RsiW
MTRWMTCREFLDFLWAYLSAEVTDAQREEFEYHLSGCPSCVAYMKSYQQTVALGKEAFARTDEPVPEDVPEDLVGAILAALRKRDEI